MGLGRIYNLIHGSKIHELSIKVLDSVHKLTTMLILSRLEFSHYFGQNETRKMNVWVDDSFLSR